jgi:hypothetical protein
MFYSGGKNVNGSVYMYSRRQTDKLGKLEQLSSEEIKKLEDRTQPWTEIGQVGDFAKGGNYVQIPGFTLKVLEKDYLFCLSTAGSTTGDVSMNNEGYMRIDFTNGIVAILQTDKTKL